jgi:hypothetical protein
MDTHSRSIDESANQLITVPRSRPLVMECNPDGTTQLQTLYNTEAITIRNPIMFDDEDEEQDCQYDAPAPRRARATPAPKPADALVRQMGIELTFMSPYADGKPNSDVDSELAGGYARILQAILNQRKVRFNDCSRDIRAVETSSPILKTWSEVEKFYKSVSNAALEIGLRPHVEKLISGGGHIHVGELKPELIAAMFREVQNRPWLNWVFNEPDDHNTHSYNSNLSSVDSKLKKACMTVGCDPTLFMGGRSMSSEAQVGLLFYGPVEHVNRAWFPNDKSRVVRYAKEYDTFEFRFFRAPNHWEEQKAHVEFVEAFIKYVEKKVKDKVKIVTEMDSSTKLLAFTAEQSKDEFLKFLTELELKHEPYQELIDDNLADWFTRGKRK